MERTTKRIERPPPEAADTSLFSRLRDACAVEWQAYTDHAFVRGLGDGSLPEPAFRHYLGQDYLFLIQFARAYGLAVYKAGALDDMRAAAASLSAILDIEMELHVKFCAGWGLSEPEMAALPEDSATTAYTRYVLETGIAGDLLDLHAALAPCIVGYAEVGAALAAKGGGDSDNRYGEWIAMYAGDEYQQVARDEVATIERLGDRRGGEARFEALARTFRAATRLEVDFWQMGLDAA
ncbi:MAG TPA: thiaminase II [Alphaproteobacteria bacterium]|nr:thiaminase II [Alphaproteobacteria bacterium]